MAPDLAAEAFLDRPADELFRLEAKVNLLHVPFRGGGEATRHNARAEQLPYP